MVPVSVVHVYGGGREFSGADEARRDADVYGAIVALESEMDLTPANRSPTPASPKILLDARNPSINRSRVTFAAVQRRDCPGNRWRRRPWAGPGQRPS